MRFAALAFVALFARTALAINPETGPQLVMVKVENDSLTWTEVKYVPVSKEVEVNVPVNGKIVVEKRTVTVMVAVQEQHAIPVKGLRATTNGKPIAEEKLAELLADETPVVFHTGNLTAKFKKILKDDAILIEFDPPATSKPVKPLPK